MREVLNDADMKLIGSLFESDQEHINKAYVHFKEAMRELLACQNLDNEVLRSMRKMYEIEDTLWQYTN